ncbi:MAG TPA: DUF4292 domain-containing protein [Chitinophagaceae bacterium]|jgi:outer membrane biogenesis lipoprotein LolB|nr:DUF4292 domain-containing protein [Chitinophagaceae bacterium]
MTRIFYVLSALVLLTSCRSTKKIQTAITRKDTTAVASTPAPRSNDSSVFIRTALQQVSANRVPFTTFSAKVNVDYRDAEDKKYDVNANIRMYRDSALWISVNAILGIEALRVLITKDSVKLLNKQDRQYTARSIDYLQEVTALPLDLRTVQDLLIGNPVFLDSNNIVSYSRGAGTVSLLSIGQFFKHLITLQDGDHQLLHSKLDDADISRNRTANLAYEAYETKRGPRFATKRRISVSEKKKLDIALDFKQYSFDEEVSFPFSIPKNYKAN